MKTLQEWQENIKPWESIEARRIKGALDIVDKYRKIVGYSDDAPPVSAKDFREVLNYIENTLQGARDNFLK
jgi:hypothetical protein